MWPHEIANGKWLLYPMRVELEGGQGPGQKGLCSPRPNILHLVRQCGRGCEAGWAGLLRQGGRGCEAEWRGSDFGKCVRGWACVGGWGPRGRQQGGDALSGLLYLEGHSLGPFPHIQDVDSRDRRRRELEQPEQPEQQVPREQQEPSTSWWPVSSAEKKKNITLVRAGQMCAGRMGVCGCDRRCGGHGTSFSEAGVQGGWPAERCDGQSCTPAKCFLKSRAVGCAFGAPHIYTKDNTLF